MRELSPGDLVLSFVDTHIAAIGIVASYCYESPKPVEFAGVGLNWEAIGWRARVSFVSPSTKIRPKDHIDVLRSLLPSRYSPLQSSANGIQSIYLTELPLRLAEVLIGLIGDEGKLLSDRAAKSTLSMAAQGENTDLEMWEHHIESTIEADPRIADTERKALILARR